LLLDILSVERRKKKKKQTGGRKKEVGSSAHAIVVKVGDYMVISF
jgi:hypothetical protein